MSKVSGAHCSIRCSWVPFAIAAIAFPSRILRCIGYLTLSVMPWLCMNAWLAATEVVRDYYQMICLTTFIVVALALFGALSPCLFGLFQVVTYCVGYRFDLRVALRSPQPLDMEMHCFPQQIFSLTRPAPAGTEDRRCALAGLYISNTIVLMRMV